MKTTRIADDKGNGFYTIHDEEDFEFANPIEVTERGVTKLFYEMQKDMVLLQVPVIPPLIEAEMIKRSKAQWKKKYAEIIGTKVPQEMISLLQTTKKSEQVRLLKGLRFNPDQLIAFIFLAWRDYQFTYSLYSAQHHHKGLNESEMPKIVELEKDGSINSVGKTSLTDGQLKQAIEQRKVTVVKFLDKGDTWHCLFVTFKSLRGEESWKGGQPHYHYISDKFGISRKEVVATLMSKDYSLPSLPHLDLLDYPSK